MNPVKVKNIEIGTGMPKIIVPIVGVTKEEILTTARSFNAIPLDVVEWRADWFEGVFDFTQVEDVLKELRNIHASQTGNVDLIDVEIFIGDDTVSEIIAGAHAAGVKVIASNHDFYKTPSKEDILQRLCKMQDMGADIPKIAVMPQSKKDVLTLLSATEEMTRCHATSPIITMSMADTGVLSRLCGEVFGSSMTFAAVGKISAPGQMNVDDVNTVLTLLHNAIQ